MDGSYASTPIMAHESDLAGRSSRRITLSLPSKDLIITECITVTSAMRKHARWKHSSVAAILGGGTTKQAPSDRRPAHSRYSSGSTSLGEEEDAPLSRWGQRGKKGRSLQDDPLLSAFARLRSDLKNVKGAFGEQDIYQAALMLVTRYPDIRYSCLTTPVPPGYPLFLY